jgi:N-methylhydantoinase B
MSEVVESTAAASAPTVLLRDLSDADFAGLYDTDRFTATVLSNRLRYSVQHVATGLLHRAFSPIIALAYDFAVAVCGPPEQGYQMAAVTNALTVFLGTMADGVKVAVEEYGPENLNPGDLLICNDPSRMGNHPNDLCFIRPVFQDGRIVSFVVLRAHQIDIGGTVAGGFSGSKRNTYENGLVISPRLMYAAGEPVRETFSMIFDNVRFGQMLLPDFKTMQSCCELGERLIVESIDRYGLPAYLGTLRYSCDATAESMRTALAGLPDGGYEGAAMLDADGIDAEEEYTVHLALRKRGARFEADFSGSSRQARTSINGGALDAKTAIGVALKMLLDPHSEFTSGSFRDIDIVIPPGTVASALPPDGPIMLYWEVGSVIFNALQMALAEALGERALGGDQGSNNVHNAWGVAADGTPWACSSLAGGETGPWGAGRAGDADGHASPYLVNIMSPSLESLEADFPLRFLRKEYVPDTAGAGVHRGGAAILKDVMWLQEAEHQSLPMRFKHPSGTGVQGGADGANGAVWVFGQDGRETDGEGVFIAVGEDSVYADAEPVAGVLDPATNAIDPAGSYVYFGDPQVRSTKVGATYRYLTNGGGGWGDPFERDPELVKRDVRDGYVSIEGAARDFGVVVAGDPERDPERLTIDEGATARLRGARQGG